MYQICVSGAARGETVEKGKALAEELGRAIAKAGHSLLTGATVGLPNYAAEAYKKAGGTMSVGISPAASKVEHIVKYQLPIKAYDTILFTGLHYVGRDTLLISSSDAVVCLGGRIGTLHEFAIAYETETPIGFLNGAGGVSDKVKEIIQVAKPMRNDSPILFNPDPEKLIAELTGFLDKEQGKYKNLYR